MSEFAFVSLDQWRKKVTLNPPNAVILKENKDDNKSVSWIEIINKSPSSIIFKVKNLNF